MYEPTYKRRRDVGCHDVQHIVVICCLLFIGAAHDSDSKAQGSVTGAVFMEAIFGLRPVPRNVSFLPTVTKAEVHAHRLPVMHTAI